jgi:excisionase family DNA binding protein
LKGSGFSAWKITLSKIGEKQIMNQITQTQLNASLFDNFDDMVTVEELAKMLKIGRNSAYELVRAGIVPSLKIGTKQIRISKPAVIDYVTSGGVKKN